MPGTQRNMAARGVTLIEILVACLLLVILGLVALALLKSSIDASAHGQLGVKVQENTRNALNTISSELRQAARPPTQGTAAAYLSGVLYPSTVDPDTAGTGRLLFFEQTGFGATSTTNYQTNIATYKIVEYRVFPNDGLGRARLVRSTWGADDSSSANTNIRGLDWSAGTFSVDLAKFNAGSDSLESRTIIELNNPNDTMAMEIYHTSTTGTAPFDYRMFRVRFALMMTLNNNLNRQKSDVVECSVYVR
jgi:Tfp pilus assembly protein PilV